MSNQIGTLKMGQKFKKTPAGEIPVDWDVRPIKDLVTRLLNGGTPDRSHEKYWEGNIPWISGADFGDQKVAVVRRHITKEAVENSATNIIPKGALLVVTRTGVGKLAIAPFDLTISQDITGILPNPQLISSEFLFWMLNFHIPKLKANHQGTSINGILREDLEAFPIPVPTITEQNKIISILSAVSSLEEKANAEIEKSKTLKKGLMCQLLTRGIGHKKFKNTQIGEIPESWQVKTLDAIKANIKNAIVDGPFGSNLKTIHYRSAGIPVIQSGCVTSNAFIAKSYVYVDEALFAEQGRSQVLPGDIVMAKIGAQAGTCAILPQNHPVGILAGNSLKITTDPTKCLSEYLVFFLHYRYSQDGLGAIKTITAQPAISLKSLKRYEIPVPNIKEQEEIVSVLSELDTDINRKTVLLEKNVCLKNGLMNVLLTGKVRCL